MNDTPRIVALVAVLALPVAAVLAVLLLSPGDEPPRETSVVRIGESSVSAGPTGASPTATPTPPSAEPPARSQLPPPPPVDDDDDDDADRGEQDDDDDDDG
ncbi:hypothetical protein ACFS2C_19090 [Prauserella oleivorans]|uniref:Small secreted hydrophilic protein n=1 Tax=Prauserella oleivorans TaxID=1478153 RepID=A0ABW5WDD3_9PSEU